MTAHTALANRFVSTLEKAGATVRTSRAGTGTIYVTVNDSYEVRFADHGECYCREDISVDPDGVTLEQAVRACGAALDLDVSTSLRAFAAASTRKTNARRFADEAARPAIEAADTARAAHLAAQAEWIRSHYPDFAERSNKAKKRIRHRANQAIK